MQSPLLPLRGGHSRPGGVLVLAALLIGATAWGEAASPADEAAGASTAHDSAWNAPDRAAKVSRLIPGRALAGLTPDTFLADWNRQLVARWASAHPDRPAPEQAYRKFAGTAPTDVELLDEFPRHIGPLTRERVATPSTMHEPPYYAFTGYCPLCQSRQPQLKYDSANAFHATTGCCGAELYGREADYPPGYALAATETATFLHLDDTEATVPYTVFTDKDGKIWELYLKTLFDQRRWRDLTEKRIPDLAKEYEKTGNPLYAHKIAILLDAAADTYYGLPISNANSIQRITRAEWEASPRPNVFEVGPYGICDRRISGGAGWLHWNREAIFAWPFAVARHDPAFKQVSIEKYGDPEALDRKIRTKLMREICLTYQSTCSQRLLNNYQQAVFDELAVAGVLAGDDTITRLFLPAQEVSLYNHAYRDGLLGEGSAGYMNLPRNNLALLTKEGSIWARLVPDFPAQHPFYPIVIGSGTGLKTARGLDLEFGDGNVTDWPPSVLGNGPAKQELESRGSRLWPDYGVGVLRIGGAGRRLELSLVHSNATGHGAADTLGIECWVDGVPVMRRGGYVPYWYNMAIPDLPEYDRLRSLYAPHRMFDAGRDGGHVGWSWNYTHSPMCQNAVTVDGVPGPDGRGRSAAGFPEVITFKGGESPGEPGAGFQVLDVTDHGSWKPFNKQVSEFRRAVIGIERPDGRAYAVDLSKVSGGRDHVLFNSAWASRTDGSLPAVTGTAADLEALLPLEGLAEGTPRSPFRQVRNVDLLRQGDPSWSITWKTDLGGYVPRDPDGTPRAKNLLPPDEGRVQLRLIGLDAGDGRSQLLSARGPWLTVIDPTIPRVPGRGVVAFEDGRDFLIEHRRAVEKDENLESLFVHVLEGFAEGDSSQIEAAEIIPLASISGPGRDTVVVKVRFSDGSFDVVLYQSQPGTVRLPDGTETDARYALFRFNPANQLTAIAVCRGSFVRGTGFSHTFGGDLRGTIVDLVGDLTGMRQETAVILQTDQPWPEGNALAGRHLLVAVTSPARATSAEALPIERVVPLSDGRVRVDLADHVPLAESWHDVFDFPEGRPGAIRTTRQLGKHANSEWYLGMQVWFPEKDKHFTIGSVSPKVSADDACVLTLAGVDDPAAMGIEPGDWFVIYGIRPGLDASVAGQWSWRR